MKDFYFIEQIVVQHVTTDTINNRTVNIFK